MCTLYVCMHAYHRLLSKHLWVLNHNLLFCLYGHLPGNRLDLDVHKCLLGVYRGYTVYSYSIVHYYTLITTYLACSVNKRLDEWISEDLLDVERLQLPRKDSKVSTLSKNSRPASPDVASLNPEPKRHNSITGRKKIKLDSAEVSNSWR